MRDTVLLNYGNILFGLERYQDAIDAYQDAGDSYYLRNNLYYSGVASYYSGLAYGKLQNTDKGKELLEHALTVWDQMEERPAEYQQVADMLNSM